MVSITWAVISFSLGLLGYIALPVLANAMAIDIRECTGQFYYGLAIKSLRRIAIVQRLLGGFELRRFNMDDEQKVGKVTLDSGLLGSDKTLEFTDPASRIKRIGDKPLALLVEGVPAAIDAELAELGYWVREQDIESGTETVDPDTGEVEGVSPYVPMSSGLRVANPGDVRSLLLKSVRSEDIETARELTKKRYEKYGSMVGMQETLSLAIGYGIGVGSVALLEYVRVELLDGGGGGGIGSGGTAPPIPPQLLGPDIHDVVMQATVVIV